MSFFKHVSVLESFTRTLTRAAFVVAVSTLLASLLGMVRDRLLASTFGAGELLDLYYAAFRIPDFFYNTVLVGMTSSAFLPVLTRYLHLADKREGLCPLNRKLRFAPEAENFIQSLASILLIGLAIISSILFVLTPYLTELIIPGFSNEQQAKTAELTRIILLSPIFLSFSGIIGNILNLRGLFFFYSLAPIVYNIGSIFSIIFLVPVMGISGLAWGIIIGAASHFLIQFIPSIAFGLKFRFAWNPWHPGIVKVLKLMIPRSIHLGALQLNLIITTLLASTLPAGSLAVFNFANNLQSLPLGIFGASYAIAAFPTLAVLVVKNNKNKFRDEFLNIMCQILFFIIPLSALMIILRAQIVRLVLGSGKFDWEDTILTLNVLGILAISLFAQSLNLLFVRAFFALHDTITPLKSGIIGVFANVLVGYFVISYWDYFAPLLEKEIHLSGLKSPVVGLALAYTVSQIAIFVFLLVGLHNKYLKNVDIKLLQKSLGKIALATLFMGAAAQIIKFFWGIFVPLQTFWAVAGQILISSVVAIAIYLFLCKILKCKELQIIRNECPKIFFKKRN